MIIFREPAAVFGYIMSAMSTILSSLLANIEHRLRRLLPADLYAEVWLDPSAATLERVFEHLRTVQHVLYNYTPRQLFESPPVPGKVRYEWQEGTLMFTDLAGFTPLMEANAGHGRQGAETLLNLLNSYFATMLEIISKSGGNLLEFTGDALLVQFPFDERSNETQRAVRAGMRMQHAMNKFKKIETPQGELSLGMRIGIHFGSYLTAEIGTPHRMDHVLLGTTVQTTKQAEGAGAIGRVCLTEDAYRRVIDKFDFNYGKGKHMLVIDDMSDEELGTYELVIHRRRMSSALILDRSPEGLMSGIEELVNNIEPLASYIPAPVLQLLVESASRREIPPQFAEPTIVFVNLAGIPQSADRAQSGEEEGLVAAFSRVFALINAATESRGGVFKKITYHLYGSDMLIIFGIPNSHSNDPLRAASTALAIREIITHLEPPIVGGEAVDVACQIGIAKGAVFAAEIGDPRGRREFNVLSDTVNTAARLMAVAEKNSILMTEGVYQSIQEYFECEDLGDIKLKGKADQTSIYALHSARESLRDVLI